jgi:hypothetical protein
MIKDRINAQIRTFTQLITPAGTRLQKDIFLFPPFSLLQQNPRMHSRPRKLIRLNLIRLIIINRRGQSPPIRILNFLHLRFLLNVLRHHRIFLLNREFIFLLQFRKLIIFEHFALDQPFLTILILHSTLILNCDFLGRLANDHIGVESDSCQQTHQNYRHVETVPLLPFEHVRRGGDYGRE